MGGVWMVGLVIGLGACVRAAAQGKGAIGGSTTNLLPTDDNAVFITRVADELTITWLSKPGMVYTIVAKDRTQRQAQWQPVEGYANMPGTGRREQVVLKVRPEDPRTFNLLAAPAAPVRRRAAPGQR